jgi:cytoskeletal protein CcmA (bactofilin family)
MFNKSGRADAALGNQPAANGKRGTGFSVLGPDVVITGNVRATADLHVEGQIDGDLDCGTLVLGPEARVKGEVRADNARIAGTIDGAVSVRQLTVEAGARITGDVEYETISLETGAHVDGRLKHFSGQAPAAKVQPALGGPKEFKMFDAPNEAAA